MSGGLKIDLKVSQQFKKRPTEAYIFTDLELCNFNESSLKFTTH